MKGTEDGRKAGREKKEEKTGFADPASALWDCMDLELGAGDGAYYIGSFAGVR